MFASVRQYQTACARELMRKMNYKFVGVLREIDGFNAYYVVDGGNGVVTSISVFDTEDGAAESARRAETWIQSIREQDRGIVAGSGEVTIEPWGA